MDPEKTPSKKGPQMDPNWTLYSPPLHKICYESLFQIANFWLKSVLWQICKNFEIQIVYKAYNFGTDQALIKNLLSETNFRSWRLKNKLSGHFSSWTVRRASPQPPPPPQGERGKKNLDFLYSENEFAKRSRIYHFSSRASYTVYILGQ